LSFEGRASSVIADCCTACLSGIEFVVGALGDAL